MLSGVNGASSWAADASESAAYFLEVALGRYSSGLHVEWSPCDEFDHDSAASLLPDHPDVWTDGSLVLDHLTGVSSSDSGTVGGSAGIRYLCRPVPGADRARSWKSSRFSPWTGLFAGVGTDRGHSCSSRLWWLGR